LSLPIPNDRKTVIEFLTGVSDEIKGDQGWRFSAVAATGGFAIHEDFL